MIRPTDTNPATLYQNKTGADYPVASIVVSNVTASAATFRVGMDHTGYTDLSTDNCQAWDVPIDGNRVVVVPVGIRLAANGRVLVRSGTAGALTFSMGG